MERGLEGDGQMRIENWGIVERLLGGTAKTKGHLKDHMER